MQKRNHHPIHKWGPQFSERSQSKDVLNSARPQAGSPRHGRSFLSCLLLVFVVLPRPGAHYRSEQVAPLSGRTTLPHANFFAGRGSAVQSQYWAVTGKSARGDFLALFQRYGLGNIGYPIDDEHQENGRMVQYFERVRLEQPQGMAGTGKGLTLGRLGAELTDARQFSTVQPFASTTSKVFIKETGHSLAEPFLSYWKTKGGLALFGYPISEPLTDNGLVVQWFERARFEYHPELAKSGMSAAGAVELTLLGRGALDKAIANPANPANPAAPGSQAGQPNQSTPPAQANLAAPASLMPGQADQPGQTKPSSPPPSNPAPPTSPAPPANPAPPPVNLSADESYMLKAINEQRAGVGAPPVRIDAATTALARARSNDMVSRNYFSHTTPEGTNFLSMMDTFHISYKWAGEILGRNNYPDDQADAAAMQSYLNSAAHKAIMLDGRFQLVGISHVKGSADFHYYTVIFIQP